MTRKKPKTGTVRKLRYMLTHGEFKPGKDINNEALQRHLGCTAEQVQNALSYIFARDPHLLHRIRSGHGFAYFPAADLTQVAPPMFEQQVREALSLGEGDNNPIEKLFNALAEAEPEIRILLEARRLLKS